MSNHYHLVLHVDSKAAKARTQQEVIERWTTLFSRNALMIDTLDSNRSSKAARDQRRKTIELWRARLMDISWFMRCLNEQIARRANKEDDCTGRFWEGRFKSQALLDEKALVTCMAYVDLNPVRAGLVRSPEESDFTSIQERLVTHARRVKNKNRQQKTLIRHYQKYFTKEQESSSSGSRLMTMKRSPENRNHESLPISQQDYFDLLSWSASQFHKNQKSITTRSSRKSQAILGEIAIEPRGWLKGVSEFEKHFYLAAGSPESLEHFQQKRAASNVVKHKAKWVRGAKPAAELYGT
jgi:REP element-mobilizing transposase RayT